MKRIFLLFSIVAMSVSCMQVEDDYEFSLEQLEELAKDDDEAIVSFMKSRKLVFDEDEDKYANNINWKVEELGSNDPQDTETLYDLMADNIIEYDYEGVKFNIYYLSINEGTGVSPELFDHIMVDYKAYNMPDNLIDFSRTSVNFNLAQLIRAWQLALPHFKSGTKPSNFPQFCDGCNPYREQIESPGKGIILVPSSLAYGNGKPMMFDMVLYDVAKN